MRPQGSGRWGTGSLLLFAACTQAFGQVSVLDSSFKIGPGANGAVNALVVQSDQRILAGGEFTTIGGCSNSFFARLHSDGLVDASFNPAGQTDQAVNCLARQSDGKVLVGGSFSRLLGQPRPALARLLEDGWLDATFDARSTFTTNTSVYYLALQDDGRVLIGYRVLDQSVSRVVRLNTNGAPDATFVCTNLFTGYVFTLQPLPDASVLLGGNFLGLTGTNPYAALFHLLPGGRLDDAFDAGLDFSAVFSLLRQTNGQILVGGMLKQMGESNSVPILRLNADLRWDETFTTDTFGQVEGGAFSAPVIYSLLPQPDGKIVVGGNFYDIAGYWRRNIVRFTPDWHVDGCFDPGLGLAEMWEPGPVRALALQPDARILVGGAFVAVDTAYEQAHLARLLPRSDCDLIRVYMGPPNERFVAATFPPGRTNYLDVSDNLTDWQTIETNTSAYIWHTTFSTIDAPQAFFRARQDR